MIISGPVSFISLNYPSAADVSVFLLDFLIFGLWLWFLVCSKIPPKEKRDPGEVEVEAGLLEGHIARFDPDLT